MPSFSSFFWLVKHPGEDCSEWIDLGSKLCLFSSVINHFSDVIRSYPFNLKALTHLKIFMNLYFSVVLASIIKHLVNSSVSSVAPSEDAAFLILHTDSHSPDSRVSTAPVRECASANVCFLCVVCRYVKVSNV